MMSLATFICYAIALGLIVCTAWSKLGGNFGKCGPLGLPSNLTVAEYARSIRLVGVSCPSGMRHLHSMLGGWSKIVADNVPLPVPFRVLYWAHHLGVFLSYVGQYGAECAPASASCQHTFWSYGRLYLTATLRLSLAPCFSHLCQTYGVLYGSGACSCAPILRPETDVSQPCHPLAAVEADLIGDGL